MREQIYIHRLRITRQGQKITFQVKLPRDTGIIGGVNISHTAKGILDGYIVSDIGQPPDPAVLAHKLNHVGELSLQVADAANIFLREDLSLQEREGRIVFTERLNPIDKSWLYAAKAGFHETHIEGSNTVIQGFYTDTYLINNAEAQSYEVIITLRYKPT